MPVILKRQNQLLLRPRFNTADVDGHEVKFEHFSVEICALHHRWSRAPTIQPERASAAHDTPPIHVTMLGLSATASAFVPQTIVAPETNELDEVDAQNELLADLELLEAMEIASRCADLVVDDAPAPLKSVANVAAARDALAARARGGKRGKGARPLSDAQRAAAAEARAKGGGKKKAGAKGRAQGAPRSQKVGKSQNDKCLP